VSHHLVEHLDALVGSKGAEEEHGRDAGRRLGGDVTYWEDLVRDDVDPFARDTKLGAKLIGKPSVMHHQGIGPLVQT
jgi:hypothetical protein